MTAPDDGEGWQDGVVPILLELAPVDIALVKFLLESYEGIAVIRTMDRRRALIVVLVSRDFLDVARGILDGLRSSLQFREIPPPADAQREWLLHYVVDESAAAD